jgi:High potential iron-sulfur protein
MTISISRRDALKGLATAAGALAAIPVVQAESAPINPHVKLDDPTAVALGYHDDAKKVDAKTFTTYQPGQMCSNCLQLNGKAGDSWRPCNLFPGKLVAAGGWCKVYLKKP